MPRRRLVRRLARPQLQWPRHVFSQIGWFIAGGISLGTLLMIFVVPTARTLFARKAVPGEIKTAALAAAGAD